MFDFNGDGEVDIEEFEKARQIILHPFKNEKLYFSLSIVDKYSLLKLKTELNFKQLQIFFSHNYWTNGLVILVRIFYHFFTPVG